MNKKAFTLIELLAVIVIIGIIAIITVPKIKDSLEKSKENIAKTSAKAYTRVIDEYILNEKMNMEKINLNGTYNIDSNGKLYNLEKEYDLKFDGKNPKNGVLVYNKNELVSGCITVDKYRTTFENGNIISTEKGSCNYEKIPTRNERIITLANEYIESIESLEITTSGIYNVTTLNNQTSYTGEKPSEGWVSIVYDETNGNWVWKYSMKYREDEVVSYDSRSQTKSTQLMQQPDIILIAGVNGKTAADEIAIGTEHFYVLENTGTKVIAIAKANLNVGQHKNNNLTEGLQGEVGQTYNVKFSETNYWAQENSPYMKEQYKSSYIYYAEIYDPINYAGEPGESNYSIAYYIEEYLAYLNTHYPNLNLTGTILTRWEKTNYSNTSEELSTILSSQSSVTQTAFCNSNTCDTIFKTASVRFSYSTITFGVRPVIEISTSNF